MRIRELMSPSVEVCTPDTELYYVARKMEERDVGAIPVVENTEAMRPIGIITDRDIVIRAIARRQNPQGLRARDCMSSDLVCAAADTDLDEALRMMEQKQVRRLIVTDENGRCCGMVAQADIAKHARDRQTGQLVQEISEPHHYGAAGQYH